MKSIPEQLFEIPADWQQRVLYTSAGGAMNYGGVRHRMLAVAGWLQQKHAIRTGDRIAVCLPKDIETVCLIYGILAAGACLVPLQFNGPTDRLYEQLSEIAPSLLFTSDRLARSLASAFRPETLPAIAVIESEGDGSGLDRFLEPTKALARPVPVDPESLAAVYFTSGTTGEPKGIMLSSRGLAGSVAALGAGDTLQRDDRMIGLTALHYAASIQIFYPVLGGCRIHLMSDDEAMFPDLVAAALRMQRITLWLAAATALRLLVDEISASDRQFETLRLVRFFGERMPVPVLRKAMDSMPHAAFENVYGASEAFSIMTHRVPRPLPDDFDALPLGQPTGQYRQILCDEAGKEVPPGEPGEICVIGDIVMAGYWNDREMTEASRLPGIVNSFRTGDLAFRSANGNYCFVGRRDHQVKLRGHRFDLGEIEAALKRHSDVRDAVAFPIATGAQRGRVLAVVLSNGGDTPESDLMAHCARRLPSFARPARIAILDRFPMLPSGKIDRQALQSMAAGHVT